MLRQKDLGARFTTSGTGRRLMPLMKRSVLQPRAMFPECEHA
jgi:hypothetical protein